MLESVLITSGQGLLGNHLIKNSPEEYQVWAGFKDDNSIMSGEFQPVTLNILQLDSLTKAFEASKAKIVIHNAAVSSIDACQSNQELAFQTNVIATRLVCQLADKYQAKVLFCSSSYVFSGEDGESYEKSLRKPLNFYGETKKIAEDIVAQSPQSLILRLTTLLGDTADHHSQTRINIRTKIVNALKRGESIALATDCFRNFLEVDTVAKQIWQLISDKRTGVIHLTSPEYLSYYELGLKVAEQFGYEKKLIKPVTLASLTSELVAIRPFKLKLLSENLIKKLK